MSKEANILLWNQFLSGDYTAYSNIYKQYVQALYSYGLHFTANRELLEDCIQDIFIKLYQKRKNLKSTDNIKLYLFITLKNHLFNIFRKNKDLSRIDSIEPVFFAQYCVEDEIINNEDTQRLNDRITRMLEILSPRQKEVIYYRFIENMSYEEITEIMGINYQSIQNLIQRSLQKLRTTFSNSQFLLLLI